MDIGEIRLCMGCTYQDEYQELENYSENSIGKLCKFFFKRIRKTTIDRLIPYIEMSKPVLNVARIL